MAFSASAIRLIEMLRRAWPGGLTVIDLARQLNLHPWRVGALLEQLEGRSPPLPLEHDGLALRLPPAEAPLIAELIEHGLEVSRIGRSVIVFQSVSSTNDVAWQAARKRNSDGLVVMAETQTAGRGRLGRSWFDRPGQSLLLSVLLLDEPAKGGLANRLTMAASVAAAEAVEECCKLQVAIRWPNDLYCHSRKLGGILAESRGLSRPDHPATRSAGRRGEHADVVIGIGINCNSLGNDLPAELAVAGSLSDELGGPVDRVGLARSVLRRLDHWLGSNVPSAKALHEAYLPWMDPHARRVRLAWQGQAIEGTIRDVDPQAGLLVELPGGGVSCFDPATVSVEWLGR